MEVSIVIRTYNEQAYIRELLQSLVEQVTHHSFEIIVVDSGSTDQTTALVRAFSSVRLIEIPLSEFTFGRALNIGMEAAKGRIGLSISGHCVPIDTHWLEEMIRPFDDASIGIVTGRQIGNELSRFAEIRIFNKMYPELSNFALQSPFANNANCAFRMSLWQSLRFDESLPGLEDLEFARRAHQLGLRSVYTSRASVYHCHLENNARVFKRFFREELALTQMNPDYRKNLLPIAWDFIYELGGDLLAAIRARRFWRCWKGILGYRVSQSYAVYLVHHGGEIPRWTRTALHSPLLKRLTRGTYHVESALALSGGSRSYLLASDIEK